jgi:trimeric autotransporter adhesin
MPILGVTGSQNTKGFLQPNAPTIGTATNTPSGRAYNNGAASVTFTAAASGAPATSYTVTSSPGAFTGTGSSSPITVTGLQSNTAYTFTVTGTNAAGTGPSSAASNSITATTTAQAPTIGTASKITSGVNRAQVTFTASANNGGAAISTYTATSSPGGITASGSSPILFTNLSGGTSYTFTVAAVNANGTGTASAASNSATASMYTCPNQGYASGSTCYYGAQANTYQGCTTGSSNQGNQFVCPNGIGDPGPYCWQCQKTDPGIYRAEIVGVAGPITYYNCQYSAPGLAGYGSATCYYPATIG